MTVGITVAVGGRGNGVFVGATVDGTLVTVAANGVGVITEATTTGEVATAIGAGVAVTVGRGVAAVRATTVSSMISEMRVPVALALGVPPHPVKSDIANTATSQSRASRRPVYISTPD